MPRRTRRHRRTFRAPSLLLAVVGLILCGAIFLFAPRSRPQPDDGNEAELPQETGTDAETDTDTGAETETPPAEPIPIRVELTSPRAVIMDLDTGRILYEKNGTEECEPASLTKLLTALTALQYAKSDTVFTAGEELSLLGPESSTAGLRPGDELTFLQLLDAMLLPSGNDAAYVMAAGVGRLIADEEDLSAKGAVAVFVEQMNRTAKSLGALSTHFTCPDGYPDREHVSTAADMARIAAAAAENETICRCTRKTTVTYEINGRSLTLKSSNRLLDPTSEFYTPGVFGLKTGYTVRAGNCMAAAAERNGKRVLAVVMGAEDSDARWRDCITCLDAAFAAR